MSSKIIYTAHVHTAGGREGAAKSSDGALDVKLSTPGSNRPGTNPEQLFAAGWSACFEGALALAARNRGIVLPPDLAIATVIDLHRGDTGYSLAARMKVDVPGFDREIAQELLDEAHETCPYSKATRGNIDVEISLS